MITLRALKIREGRRSRLCCWRARRLDLVGGGNTFCLLDAMQRRGALAAVARRGRAGRKPRDLASGADLSFLLDGRR